ncbi:MAG: serine hydrolase, partial [Gammaproteobacteria bacterium]|nr:serine hydrolase [Gammaproteobacteria bacterium]
LDVIGGETLRLGLGLGLDSDDFPCVGPGSIHWGGAGGSIVLADRDRRVSFGYAMNKMYAGFNADPRNEPLRLAFNEIARGL